MYVELYFTLLRDSSDLHIYNRHFLHTNPYKYANRSSHVTMQSAARISSLGYLCYHRHWQIRQKICETSCNCGKIVILIGFDNVSYFRVLFHLLFLLFSIASSEKACSFPNRVCD